MSSSPPARPRPRQRCSRRTGRWARGAVRMSPALCLARPTIPACCRAGGFAGTRSSAAAGRRERHARPRRAGAARSTAMTALRALPLVAIHARQQRDRRHPAGRARSPRWSRQAGGLLVVDAVQAAGRIPLDISSCYADYLILSSHKIGGPKGVGAIVAAADLMMPKPLITGGGQEKGHRAGTENLAGIAGFGAAAAEARADARHADAAVRSRATGSRPICCGARPRRRSSARLAERLANTSFFAIAGHQGRDRADRLRSCRRCAVGRLGLLVGQGRAEPCAEGDGPWRQTRRPARLDRPRDQRGGDRAVRWPRWRRSSRAHAAQGRGRLSAAGERCELAASAGDQAGRVNSPAETHYMKLTPLIMRCHSLKTAGP